MNGFIAYTVIAGSFPPKYDVWILPLSGDRKPFPFAQTGLFEASGMFSPDGRRVAYVINESGQPNVYVRPFLGEGQKYPISKDGGSHPVWRADGKELFYLGSDGTLMAVAIAATGHNFMAECRSRFSVATGRAERQFQQHRPGVRRHEGWPAISRQCQGAVQRSAADRRRSTGLPRSRSNGTIVARTSGTRLGSYEITRPNWCGRHGRGLSRARYAS